MPQDENNFCEIPIFSIDRIFIHFDYRLIMARFQKTALRAGTFPKGGQFIHVRPEDLKTAHDSYKKMLGYGYRAPVIIEHSSPTDPHGLPVKKEQAGSLSARDRAKYQAGWGEDVVFSADGHLDVIADVKTKDGIKLAKEVQTYISPQFGPWTIPDTGETLPMAITHFAMTPVPVDIGQSPEWTELPDGAEVIAATQLSQQVTFSMAGFIPEKKSEGYSAEKQGSENPDAADDAKGNHAEPDGDEAGAGADADDESGIKSQMPDIDGDGKNDESVIVNQVIQMLKEHGVVVPEGTAIAGELKVVLAGLMSAAHAKNMANQAKQAEQQPQQPQNPMQGIQNPDPRLAGTKTENMFTMSQATAKPDTKTDTDKTQVDSTVLKTLPEYIQMSQQNEAFAAELTEMKREKYQTRIQNLFKTGRITKAKADAMLATVGTYQFSTAGTSKDVAKLDVELEFAEENLPEGAVWSPDERVKQMSLVQERDPKFITGDTVQMSTEDEEAELERRFGKIGAR